MVSVSITSGDAETAVRLFGVIAPSASFKLLESIVEIASDLLAMDWAVFARAAAVGLQVSESIEWVN
jgi:hypothetical protein